MTAKVFTINERGQPEKMKGWFSWRHPTNKEHLAATEEYQRKRGPAARKRKAQERLSRNA